MLAAVCSVVWAFWPLFCRFFSSAFCLFPFVLRCICISWVLTLVFLLGSDFAFGVFCFFWVLPAQVRGAIHQ